MNPDAICGTREYVQFVQPHVERAMQTYEGITRVLRESEAEKYFRQRMEAAVSILERIIGQDLEDEILREMERRENREYRRKQNLMMAGMALEKIRSANGEIDERDFSRFQVERAIYRTHYGMQMLGIKEVLEKFWTGE